MKQRTVAASGAAAAFVFTVALCLSACDPQLLRLIAARDLLPGTDATLIAHFAFDGDVVDSTGLAEEITSSAGVRYVSGVGGAASSALTWQWVDGDAPPPVSYQYWQEANSSAVLSFLLPPDKRPGTVAFWAALLVQDSSGGGQNRFSLMLSLEEAGGAATTSPPSLVVRPSSYPTQSGTSYQLTFSCQYYLSSSSSSYGQGATPAGLSAANWFHLALSVDPAGHYTWYVNGTLVVSNTGSTFGLAPAGSRWRVYVLGPSNGIGNRTQTPTFALDEIMVYDQPIRPEQAAALFQAGMAR